MTILPTVVAATNGVPSGLITCAVSSAPRRGLPSWSLSRLV
ncbi:hypothetical protein ACWEQC_04350 [Streptomyces shenzhenensis]